MSVYKEGYHIINYIEANTHIIEEGYLDEGVAMVKGDTIWNMVNQLVTWYGVEGSRYERVFNNHHVNIGTDVALIDEWAVSDGRKSIDQATDRYRVMVTKHGNKMWCSIAKYDYEVTG